MFIKQPKNLGEGKIGNLLQLLEEHEDIASTHALFKILTPECKDAIRQGEYVLYIDEALSALEPYELANKNDLDYLLEKQSIEIDSEGFVKWIDKDLDTAYNQIKTLTQNRCLFYIYLTILESLNLHLLRFV